MFLFYLFKNTCANISSIAIPIIHDKTRLVKKLNQTIQKENKVFCFLEFVLKTSLSGLSIIDINID